MARGRLDLYRKQRAALPRPGGRARRVLAASLITVGLLGVTSIAVTSVVAPAAVAAALKDPSSLLALRSPGHRGLALLQTKHKKPAAAPERERASAPEEPRPEPAPVFALIEPGQEMPPIVYDQPGVPGPEEAAPPGAEIEMRPPGEGPPGGATTLVEGPPGGGGGGGGGGGCCGGTTTITTDTPGVPEPSVWAMLIVGFFSVGAGLRAQRRRTPDAVRA